MAAKPKHEAPRRIIDNLGMLREALSKEAFACSGLHHVLVARNDNLGHEVIFGPNGFLQGGELDFPTDGGRRVNGLSGSFVLGR